MREKKSLYNYLDLNVLKAKAVVAGKDYIVQVYVTVIINKIEYSWKMEGFNFQVLSCMSSK